MFERKPQVGDRLFHNSERRVTGFYPSQGVVYLGTTRGSIDQVGGSGYLNIFEIISDLGQQGVYGGRSGWGRNKKWVSMPAELASEVLQHIETEETA